LSTKRKEFFDGGPSNGRRPVPLSHDFSDDPPFPIDQKGGWDKVDPETAGNLFFFIQEDRKLTLSLRDVTLDPLYFFPVNGKQKGDQFFLSLRKMLIEDGKFLATGGTPRGPEHREDRFSLEVLEGIRSPVQRFEGKERSVFSHLQDLNSEGLTGGTAGSWRWTGIAFSRIGAKKRNTEDRQEKKRHLDLIFIPSRRVKHYLI
jgi:hypothetical protein